MKILIGNAWPYANGPLHLGHIAALLPGDVLARYHRAKGDEVYFVSGSDCHGTPVALRARKSGETPQALSDGYHEAFSRTFARYGFGFDHYGKTSSQEHKAFVEAFHRTLYESGLVFEKESLQAYCPACGQFLADRYVVGQCPACEAPARGDQCEDCGAVLEPEHLTRPQCALCGQTPTFRLTKHLFLEMSKLEKQLGAYVRAHGTWRKNALAMTQAYLDEGLRDRAITRDLEWGVPVPRPGYEDKRIYIWAENVLGYLSTSKELTQARGQDFRELWSAEGELRHYYVHGKDNIPFHTVILPCLLMAHGQGLRLPDEIISSEYLTLEGRKISTSRNWAIWADDLAERYDPDSIRYYLLSNGPEKRDADFSWQAYIHCHNGELLGAYGNLVNRTLVFLAKYGDGQVPQGTPDEALAGEIRGLYDRAGGLIQRGRFKESLDEIFAFVREGNRYYDAQRPWETRTSAPEDCGHALFNCVQILANLGILLEPFLPFSTAKLRAWLGMPEPVIWSPAAIPAGQEIRPPALLFERIDKARIQEERQRLILAENKGLQS